MHYLDNGATGADAARRARRGAPATRPPAAPTCCAACIAWPSAATEAYENARARGRDVPRRREPTEVVFTGGCTAAINLVAYCLRQRCCSRATRSCCRELEHHSATSCPGSCCASARGVVLDMLPVTDDGRIDLDRARRAAHARARKLDRADPCLQRHRRGDRCRRACVDAGASRSAPRCMLDGAQRAPHGPLDLPALGIDFYAFAGHKAYGPNGVGVLWGRPRAARGDAAVHGRRRDDRPRDASPRRPMRRRRAASRPARRRSPRRSAWAPRCDWMRGARLDGRRTRTRCRWPQRLIDGLQQIDGARILGPAGLQNRLSASCPSRSTACIRTTSARSLDSVGVALRGGHHCAQPLMDRFDLDGTTRATSRPTTTTPTSTRCSPASTRRSPSSHER